MSSDARAPACGDSFAVRATVAPSPGISAMPVDKKAVRIGRIGDLRSIAYVGVVVVLVAAGSLSLLPLWLALGHRWANDPLRSIGAIFPLVACIGVVAAWRRIGWSRNGSFWGLLPVALSVLLAGPIAASGFGIVFNGMVLALANAGTVLFLYGIGAVLLFGGPRLLRAAIAPVCLLLLVIPVPSAFNTVVDLPLQFLSASTARSFAHLIGLQPTGEQLRMMFTPDFGMFIAPGCNGIRGSITLGYLALIFGYARHLRPRTLALITLAALLLGYALNLLRLCVLVVYYRIGVGFPSIQKYGAETDYAIGCFLFLLAALGFGMLIRSLEPRPVVDKPSWLQKPGLQSSGPRLEGRHRGYAAVARALCFVTLTFTFALLELRAAPWRPKQVPIELNILNSFPAEIGSYRLMRTWSEHDTSTRMMTLAMAEYAAPSKTVDTTNRFTLGLWVGLSTHLVADSKFSQGILPNWNGSFDASARQALPVHFLTSYYDDGISRQYDAESLCSESGCQGHLSYHSHRGMFFAVPEIFDLDFAHDTKRLPILLRREWLDSDPASDADLRARFEADARLFMAQVDLRPLLDQAGSQR